MTAAREEFLDRMRAGMRGLPRPVIEGALADYASHFDEGRAAGRDEAQIARALGDPLALAEQMRLETEIASWETSNTPRTGWRVVAASLRRVSGALPQALLGVTAVLLIALSVPIAVVLVATSVWLAIAGGSLGLPGGAPVAWLAGLGTFAAALSISAMLGLVFRFIVNALVSRARRGPGTQSSNRIRS